MPAEVYDVVSVGSDIDCKPQWCTSCSNPTKVMVLFVQTIIWLSMSFWLRICWLGIVIVSPRYNSLTIVIWGMGQYIVKSMCQGIWLYVKISMAMLVLDPWVPKGNPSVWYFGHPQDAFWSCQMGAPIPPTCVTTCQGNWTIAFWSSHFQSCVLSHH